MTVQIGDSYRCTRCHPMGAGAYLVGKSYEVTGFDEDDDAILIPEPGFDNEGLGVPFEGALWGFVHEPKA